MKAGATVAGFSAGEEITIEDMLYGIILPSGGDASIGIAEKLAGSEEAFVKLMNKKAKELGLTIMTLKEFFTEYQKVRDFRIFIEIKTKDDSCKELVDDMSEIISIYYGEEVDEEKANELGEKVSEMFPDCDVEVHFGGQPIYYYVVSVE